MWIGRVQIHLEIESQEPPAARRAFSALMQAAGLPLFHLKKLSANVAIGNDRVAGLSHFFYSPAQCVGHEGQRFFEAGVAGQAGSEAAVKLSRRQTAADFSLQRFAPSRSIHDPMDVNGIHLTADARKEYGQQIHDEARVDASADHAGSAPAANLIEPLRECRFAQSRKNQLLA